ncbi:MAG: hypothetical protein IJU66_07320, partial [Oscillospiraceae bacterium]|nr:hypothetical protein [Oscillospiraceae bacterium]
MKRKLTSLFLAVLVMLSATIPAFAEDGAAPDDECGAEELIRLLICRCSGGDSAQADWNEWLNALLSEFFGAPAQRPQEQQGQRPQEQPAQQPQEQQGQR